MKNYLILLWLFAIGCKSAESPSGTPAPPVTPVDTVGTFKNPILSPAPDPWVIHKDGFYYVMHTTATNLRIYKTRSISRLSAATPVTVWIPPATGPNARNIWAPELHHIDGKWYIYYTADNGVDGAHRMFVLENAAADPTTGTWIDRGQLNLPDNKWAIDGTVVRLNGQLLYAWSGWENDLDRTQNIYVCKLTNPYTAEGPRVRVSAPELTWEKEGFGVNEGPQFLVHGGKVFIIYSASFCGTDQYALGQLSADTTANLVAPTSWTKSPNPVFGPYASGTAYGVGHNSFFTTPGPAGSLEYWLVYHANPAPGQGCADFRSARMQPFGWKPDGSPDFGSPVSLNEYIKRPSGD
ncbi:GH43 family beta-xylosidase [Larkinella arboricola]|uniref:GH43 family beta-xylosidase n=1 Tax=Larkinella arboricola TaxID=643671 RepID=A0A327WNR3_LARAB|nr:glycoside hydrolase family 43 protein [Larkinella arboricola]RAJ92644.1 GH43 family beta-xylosidase [Larkinella arboricola]